MDKKTHMSELQNDKQFWKATAGAVEDDLPTNYVGEVQELLKEQGFEVTTQSVVNVKLGRNKSNRVVAKAIYEVGLRHRQKEKVA